MGALAVVLLSCVTGVASGRFFVGLTVLMLLAEWVGQRILGMKPETDEAVKSHVSRIDQKLGVLHRTDAVRRGRKQGLIRSSGRAA